MDDLRGYFGYPSTPDDVRLSPPSSGGSRQRDGIDLGRSYRATGAALETQIPPSKRASKKVRMRDDQPASMADGTGDKGGDGEEMDEEG